MEARPFAAQWRQNGQRGWRRRGNREARNCVGEGSGRRSQRGEIPQKQPGTRAGADRWAPKKAQANSCETKKRGNSGRGHAEVLKSRQALASIVAQRCWSGPVGVGKDQSVAGLVLLSSLSGGQQPRRPWNPLPQPAGASFWPGGHSWRGPQLPAQRSRSFAASSRCCGLRSA